MRDLFQRIGNWMRVVIHWIDDPLRSLPVMRHIHDAEQYRVAHVDIARRHVDLSAQHMSAILEFTATHAFEQTEVFVDGSVPVGALLTGFGQCPPILANLIGAETITYALPLLIR